MMTGFSGGIEAEDERGLLPRSIIFGNFSVGGVLLAYGDLQAPGLNLVSRQKGEAIHEALLALHDAGQIRPVIGRVESASALPAALECMERRETMGRTVLDWKTR